MGLLTKATQTSAEVLWPLVQQQASFLAWSAWQTTAKVRRDPCAMATSWLPGNLLGLLPPRYAWKLSSLRKVGGNSNVHNLISCKPVSLLKFHHFDRCSIG